jgi:hypothetical protein
MRLGVISDIHDNIWALETAMARPGRLRRASEPRRSMLSLYYGGHGRGLWQTHSPCMGNNDGDKLLIAQRAAQQGNVTLHGDMAN